MAVPTVRTGDLLVSTFCMSSEDQAGLNTAAWEVVDEGAKPTLIQLATYLADLVRVNYSHCLCSTAQYDGTTIYRVTPDSTPTYFSPRNVLVGDYGDNPMPLEMCGIVSKKTSTRGPKGQGRFYFPFLDRSVFTSGGVVDPAYIAAMQATADLLGPGPITLTGAGGEVGIRMVLFSAGFPGVLRPVEQFLARPRLGQQHSRGMYGAANHGPY